MNPPPQMPASLPPMVATRVDSPIQEHYMHKCVLGLSITQLVIGSVAFIFQIILILVKSNVSPVGQGIWTGIFFIITGSLGIQSSKKKTTCWIVPFLVMAILSSLLSIGLLIPSAVEWGIIEDNDWRYYSNGHKELIIALSAMMIFMAVLQLIMAILSSAFACHGLCCRSSIKTVFVPGVVQYVSGPNGEQQVVIVPANQQVAAGMPLQTSLGPSAPAYPGTSHPQHQSMQPAQPPAYSAHADSAPPAYETKEPIP